MNEIALKETIRLAIAYYEPVFNKEKLKEDLFAYYGTTDIDASYCIFFTKKSGHVRRKEYAVRITPASVLLPCAVKINWKQPADFVIHVHANVHEDGKDPLKGYVTCPLEFIYDSDLNLMEIVAHYAKELI